MAETVAVHHKSETESLFKKRSFLFIWAITICSSFSIAIFQFSQSWYVVKTLDKEASLGIVFIAANVPRILFMAIGGVLADRVSRTKILFVANFLRTLLLVGLLIMLATGHLSLLSFIIFGLFFGALDAFVWPANGSLLPNVVDQSQLTRANSVIQTTQQSSLILGPMIGGLLVASSGGYMLSFGVPAVMLLLAAILASLLNVPATISSSTAKPGMWQSIKEGIDVVRQSAFLKALFLSTIFLNVFVIGPLMMGLPIFVKNVLDGNALEFSFIEGAMALGMLISSVIIGILNVKKRRGLMVTVSLFAMNIFFFLFSQSSSLYACMFTIFFIGITFPATNIPLISAVQSSVDKNLLGRLMGLLTMASMGLAPLSLAATSLLISYGFSIENIMSGGALSLIVVNLLIMWKLPALRKME
ncbi:MFS transporter [Fictibacillus sp. 7GRE50]|uniref:MFS transporter n=1 Tax=unclassified Fictibacillus TaxID=2644029 RepID=UPI0018CF5347|nr:MULTISPECIES: MFS transporter [unclassified Fictibacillus]MBH0165280.1 MFS transporter [Fictibacillus sp. 7GRE50]MBH0172127.1 MFS transporter [Fictibacillus sp. 23RED33]